MNDTQGESSRTGARHALAHGSRHMSRASRVTGTDARGVVAERHTPVTVESHPEVTLPDGTTVSCVNREEAKLIFRNLPGYFRHGIDIKDGDTAFIQDYGIKAIDLLKLDVEKSELDVLTGIEEGHWGRIRQIVMEVEEARC